MMWTGTTADGARRCSSGTGVIPEPWLHASLNLDPVDPALARSKPTGRRPDGWEDVQWAETILSGRVVAVRGEPVEPVPVVVGWFGDTTEVVAEEWLREKWGLGNGESVTLDLDANPTPVNGGTVCLVARRSDGGERDRSWRWIRERWEAHTDIPIFVGYDGVDGPYNNSRARNVASVMAGGWDTAIISDADSFCGFDQIQAGIDLAESSGLHSICFTRFCYLTRAGSEKVMGGYNGSWERLKQWTFKGGCSSMLAVPRHAWDAVGGMDEGFVGWGEEDVAFSIALQTMNPHRQVRHGETLQQLRAGFNRLRGDCWHIWHPVQETNDPNLPGYKANVARRERYVEAAHQPEKMRALLEEFGVL